MQNHPWMLVQSWLKMKLAQWFWRRRMYFCYNFPMENCMALHLNELEFPSPDDALCQVYVKFALWFWGR